ncbi:hypothetical protein DL93DRAFT_819875 [Clavulina sp. PMI_390]|nr:hypothetical protein DL93DRAFT_819875 [Clavulina sp. PMI_390]
MSVLSRTGGSLAQSLRASLRPSFTPLGTRFASSNASASSSSEVAPAGQTAKDLVAEDSKDLVTAEVVSGAPHELQHRAVRIYQPTRNTMQSGGAKGEKWRIDFDVLQGGGRWENPLMGWASSADYMQGTRVSFNTKEDAIHFAEKQGWDYFIQQPTVKRIPPKNYAENYRHHPGKIRIAHTK